MAEHDGRRAARRACGAHDVRAPARQHPADRPRPDAGALAVVRLDRQSYRVPAMTELMSVKPCKSCEGGECSFSRYCGAYICNACGAHLGLVRCYCGWAADGGDGRRQLIDHGETIDDE